MVQNVFISSISTTAIYGSWSHPSVVSRELQILRGRVGLGWVRVDKKNSRIGSGRVGSGRIGSGRVKRSSKSCLSGRVRYENSEYYGSGRVGSGQEAFIISRVRSVHAPGDEGHVASRVILTRELFSVGPHIRPWRCSNSHRLGWVMPHKIRITSWFTSL